jgi:hypothetical protein
MRNIQNLRDFKERLQAGFDNNEESLELFGETYSTQLKAYLIESNHSTPNAVGCPCGKWQKLDSVDWYVNKGKDFQNTLFLDSTRDRVWIMYSIMGATESDGYVEHWIKSTTGLDNCWLSRNQLLHWEGLGSWSRRGLGLKFSDGLSPEEEAGNFSLKAWYGANRYIQGLDEILKQAEKKFAIHSVRWQKRTNGSVSLSAEWYSNGKATINRATDVDEVLIHIAEMGNWYSDALNEATNLRDKSMGAFEIDFSQEIDLEAFSDTVARGIGEMKLWLVETEAQPDFRRFRGIDLHTWDRVLLDVGTDFAHLTIPGVGCVNAAPRIAAIQGEDNAGKTSIFYDGVRVFA